MLSKQRLMMFAVGAALAFTAELYAQEPVDRTPVARSVDAGHTPKVCVLEQVTTTKTVYTVVCKDYCIKHTFRLFHGLCSVCGLCDEEGQCQGCEQHQKLVLVKKTVPDKCVMKCVLKDAPPAVVVYEKAMVPFDKIAEPKK